MNYNDCTYRPARDSISSQIRWCKERLLTRSERVVKHWDDQLYQGLSSPWQIMPYGSLGSVLRSKVRGPGWFGQCDHWWHGSWIHLFCHLIFIYWLLVMVYGQYRRTMGLLYVNPQLSSTKLIVIRGKCIQNVSSFRNSSTQFNYSVSVFRVFFPKKVVSLLWRSPFDFDWLPFPKLLLKDYCYFSLIVKWGRSLITFDTDASYINPPISNSAERTIHD